MHDYRLTIEALEGKLEYIDRVFYLFDYAEKHGVVDVAGFIKGMIKQDQESYTSLINWHLDRLCNEEK